VSEQANWYAIEIIVSPDAVEAVEHLLNEFDALGIEIDQLRKKADEDVTVVGYFSEPISEADVKESLDHTLAAFDIDDSNVRSINSREVENADWLSEWKKHWRPTRSGRFVVAPSWFDVEDEASSVVIRIEPNMAFGTGTHETTKLCLKAIDEYYDGEMSFLDVGTGTGILAIAAAKLFTASSPKILGIDVDKDSVDIARENAAANDVSDKIEFVQRTLDDGIPDFEFVCANLTLDVISPMLPELIEKTQKTLVLSGILTEQEDSIVKELSRLGLKDQTIWRDGEWIAVLVRV
jgi:ribosomal protein L11 methyltransferase